MAISFPTNAKRGGPPVITRVEGLRRWIQDNRKPFTKNALLSQHLKQNITSD